MKRVVSFVAVLALALASSAIAQVQTGSILIRAVDEQGAVMPGVSITISSPVLVGGSMSGVTDAGGVNRFPSLVPGTYTIKVELSGFTTVTRENIAVLVGQTTPVEFAMKVAAVAENITVTGASPTVDTTSATVAVNLSEQLIQGTPGGRDIWALVEAKVPGLVISRPDVGGASGGLQGTFSARGTASAQNTSFLNGINVGDPAAIGAAGFYYDFDAFDDIQVSTGAHDITVPTSGVFLNMITKTGGNRWNGTTTFTYTNDSLQGRNDTDPTLQKYGFRPNGNTSDFVSDINVAAGGPLVQNKVRFFGSFRDWRVHQNVPVQNSQSVLDQTNITSGLGNVTWQANQNNRITGFYSRQRYSKPNRLLNSVTVTVPESTVDEEDMFDLAQGLWNSVLGKNFFIDARFGLNKILFPTYFNGGTNQSLTDNATGIIYGNNTSQVVRHRDRYQSNATAQYYKDHALGGRHEFKFGFDYSHAVTKNETTRPDNVQVNYTSASGSFVPQTVTLFATPQNDATALNVLALFAQDSYSVKRLTITGGLRYEQLEGYLPSQSSPASPFATAGVGGFAQQPRSYDEIRDIVKWNTAGPRVAAIVDVTGDGKTAAKLAAGRYYYILSTGGGGVSSVNRNANYSEQYTWNDANGDHKFQLGEQTGTPVVSAVVVNGAILTSIDPNFSRPYTDEYSFGLDRELAANFKLSAVFTYRREKNTQASANPDNPYATTLTTAVDPGVDGVVGTADDGTYGFYQRLSAANRVLITNDPNVLQSYKGLELTLTKRFTDRWQMLAGYTRSVNRLDNVSVDVSPNFLINSSGVISTDAAPGGGSTRCGGCGASNTDKPNQFKLTGMYVLPWHEVILSANYSGVSGPAVTRQISRALAIGGAQVINLEPMGNTRLDFQNRIDLRVGKTLKFANSKSMELTADFDNLTNASWVWQVRSLTTSTAFTDPTTGSRATLQQFLSPSSILQPRTVVLRAAVRF
ncbi:MAG TPA: TonB-dependent receptor [Vicinamibacterales bacterium]|nr:TonB-dependent receptor [Vicinamibacterales bacterium]